METSDSGANHAVLLTHKTGEVWDPEGLLIQVIKALLWMHKTTDEGWDPYRLAILVLKSLFSMQKNIGDVWDQ